MCAWNDTGPLSHRLKLRMTSVGTHTHTHTHPHTHLTALFPGLPGWASNRSNLDFNDARDSEWQWHQLGHMQVCISIQTDNHASTPPLKFFTGRMPFLPPNQQRQSTEGKGEKDEKRWKIINIAQNSAAKCLRCQGLFNDDWAHCQVWRLKNYKYSRAFKETVARAQ